MRDDAAVRRVLVAIPTWNERESLPELLTDLRTSQPAVDVLVVDDGSPDGTGAVADEWAGRDAQVHVLHRYGKEGLARAYLAAFDWGDRRGYDALVQMDADGSHRPQDLPTLLAAAEHADVVIGSRYVRGGRVVNWPPHRQALSRAGNTYARLTLGLPVADATAGFRVYRTTALRRLDLTSVAVHGYAFQVDLTRRAVRAGLRVAEVPITFVERVHGASKMNPQIVAEAMIGVTAWALHDAGTQLGHLVRGRR
jgi:dolichol-phosphate mannosyltransferase